MAALVFAVGSAAAAQSVIYSDSSSEEKLESKVGVAVEEDGFSLQADMTMVGEDGTTQVLPRITSAWSGLEFIDVETVLRYEDWNQAADPLAPTVATKLLLDAGLPFVDRIEGKVMRAAEASNESFGIDFSRLDTGLTLLGGDALGFAGAVTMKSVGESAAASSSITSSFGLGSAVDVESVLRVDDTAGASSASQAFDTKLVYAPDVVFVDKIEGAVQRSSSGATEQSLAVLFPEISGGSTLRISSKAVVEEMLHPDGLESVSMGIETRLSGFLPQLAGGTNALSFRTERRLDGVDAERSSLAYDHAWSPGDTSIGLNLKLLREVDEDVEPSLGITWSTQF